MSEKSTYEELEQRVQELELAESKRKRVEEALRESEKRYQLLTESLVDTVYEFDSKGKFTYVNESGVRMLGYSKDELFKKVQVRDTLSEEDQARSREDIGEIFKGKTIVVERTFIRKDGTAFIGEIHSGPIYKGKNVVGVRGILRDITERKQAEEALRESEEKYQDLYENAPDMFASVCAKTATILDCNQTLTNALGYTKEEIIGRLIFDIYTPDSAEYAKENVFPVFMKTGTIIGEELQLQRKDGHKIDVSLNTSAVRDNQRNILYSRSILRNVTERKRMENKLKVSEVRYRALFENMLDGIAVYEAKNDGEDFVIVDLNAAGEKISNTSREAVIGKSVLKEFPGVQEFGLFEVFQSVWKTGKSAQHPIAQYTDDHISHWSENSVFKLPSGEIVAVYSDETARRQAEKWLRDSEERHRLFFENSSIGIIHYNNEGIITAVNDTMIAIFGSSREKLIGLDINNIPDKKFSNEVYKSLNGEHGYYEGEYKSYTGEKTATIDANWMPIIRDGEVVAGVGLVEDVTEKKQAEEALRESEEKYRSMMEAMVDPTYICTSDFRVSYMNPAMVKSTGYDATGELCYKTLYAFDEQCPWCVHEKILQGKSVETEIDSPEDSRSFETSNAPIFHQDGSISKITIYRDITDRKLTQNALIESEEVLKIKAKNLEELNAALKVLLNKRQEDKKEFEEGILSNLRTLIEPHIVKLKRSKLSQSQKTLLNILESNLNEMVSPFTRKLSSKYFNLTPTQIQVANLVKQGKTNKDISEILHVAVRTIAFHRENIRKKLGLTNLKTNLRTYLMSID